jgi:phosphate transport system substrate-binding protein
MERRPQGPRVGLLQGLALLWLGLLVGFAVGIEWIRSRPEPPTPSGGIDLVGAGATFPYPLYRQWFADYGRETGVRINYFSVGSHEGLRLLLSDSVDFGASDRPMTAEERSAARCGPIEIPMVVGAVAVAYRLPGLNAPLRLDADVLADLLGGSIARWNDPKVQALNPGTSLPATPVTVIRRARETGTSAVFARYLSTSPRWRGDSTLTAASASVEGNEGVTAAIAAQVGAIGIVEYTYAKQAQLDVALLRNAAGVFVAPSAASIAAAASERLTPNTVDTALGAIGALGGTAYPAVAVTRLSADAAIGDSVRGPHFLAFARWALADGAAAAAALGYAALPPAVLEAQRRRLDALRPGRCLKPRTP